MGLAPKQRDQLSTENMLFAALVPVPLSRRANRVAAACARNGDRHRDEAFSRDFRRNSARSQSPFLASVFTLRHHKLRSPEGMKTVIFVGVMKCCPRASCSLFRFTASLPLANCTRSGRDAVPTCGPAWKRNHSCLPPDIDLDHPSLHSQSWR